MQKGLVVACITSLASASKLRFGIVDLDVDDDLFGLGAGERMLEAELGEDWVNTDSRRYLKQSAGSAWVDPGETDISYEGADSYEVEDYEVVDAADDCLTSAGFMWCARLERCMPGGCPRAPVAPVYVPEVIKDAGKLSFFGGGSGKSADISTSKSADFGTGSGKFAGFGAGSGSMGGPSGFAESRSGGFVEDGMDMEDFKSLLPGVLPVMIPPQPDAAVDFMPDMGMDADTRNTFGGGSGGGFGFGVGSGVAGFRSGEWDFGMPSFGDDSAYVKPDAQPDTADTFSEMDMSDLFGGWGFPSARDGGAFGGSGEFGVRFAGSA